MNSCVRDGLALRRIAYFTNVYPAVSHTFIRREIEALEEQGWDVARFAIRGSDTLVDERDLSESKKTSYLLPFRVRELFLALLLLARRPIALLRGIWQGIRMACRDERGLFRSLAIIPEAMILSLRLRRSSISFVHGHFGTNSASVLRIVNTFGACRYSFTNHGPLEIDHPRSTSLREKVNDASFVVAISGFARGQMLRVVPPEAWNKIHVVRCGVVFDSRPSVVSPVPDCSRLLCIGRLSNEKGHLILLRAAKRLIEEGMELSIALAGDGPLRPVLERETRRLELSAVVEFLGSVSGQTVLALLEQSRSLVLPSLSEGLPIVLMESFSSGRPVIATRVGAISELVEQNVSGWLVAPGDVDELACAMREALTLSPEVLTRMGQAGFAVVAERHNVDVETRRLAALFAQHAPQHSCVPVLPNNPLRRRSDEAARC